VKENNRKGLGKTPFYEGSVSAIDGAFFEAQKLTV
jgi:hypothetical protein